jgi:hypothetical protein
MAQRRTREELEAELADLISRLERIGARKANGDADDFQNLEESAQSHADDEVIDRLENRTRARIAELQASLAIH